MGFCGLGVANSKSGNYNFLSSGQILEYLGWSQCWLQEIQISAMHGNIPLDLNQLLDIGVHQWLQIRMVNPCQWVYAIVQ